MSTIRHHPRAETLASYASGRLDEARSVVIATHAASCDACRTAIHDFEAVGGVCLQAAEPVAMNPSAMASFWARAGRQDAGHAPASSRAANDFDLTRARPLSARLRGGLDRVQWRPVAPGISQHVLDADGYRAGVLRLLKIQPGTRMPKHSHGDEELTLILRGAYLDEVGEFGPGDLADLDGETTHAPRAIGEEPCICLIATNAPLVFKDFVGKVVQPFIRL